MAKRGTKRANDQPETEPTKRRSTRSSTRLKSSSKNNDSPAESSKRRQTRRQKAASTTTGADHGRRSSSSNDNNKNHRPDKGAETKIRKGKQRAYTQDDELAEQFMQAEENEANRGGRDFKNMATAPSSPPIPMVINEQDQEDSDSDMDDEDNIDWEDVKVPEQQVISSQQQQQQQEDGSTGYKTQEASQYKDVEVVFEAPRAVLKKSKWQAEYDRSLREAMHHSHVMLLIGHYMIRNAWCASNEVQAVCLSVVPDHIQKQCGRKDESEKDFETGVKWLLTWWREYFTLVGAGLVTRAYDDYAFLKSADLTAGNFPILGTLEKHDMVDGENIPSAMEFIDKLVSQEGFRDTSGELFVAILRALSFDARLVCSLQPLPYRIPTNKRKEPSVEPENSAETSTTTEKLKFPMRTPRPKLQKDTTLDEELKARNAKPPTVWAEVFNPFTEQWVCIDPIRGYYNQRKSMEPSSGDRRNVTSIVLAFPADQDGCVDVTRRYTSNMGKAMRLREKELTKREKEGGFNSWWEGCYRIIQRKRWGKREEKEQDELENLNTGEPMPTSIGAFNNHPLYALERHLKKFEVLHPKEPVLGHIRGESIYPRSCVKPVHTAETWIKQGRVIKDGEQPVKRVNARAVTMERKRAQELAKQEGAPLQVACYGTWQTDVYKPPPVVDGIVPRNAYGRVDLYTPEMLPPGAAHIPINGIAKIARRLGINYAEAVVDFEFIKRRSVPVTAGIVVAKENKAVLLEAWEEHQHTEATKAIKKQEKEVYGRWRKLILGTLIQARLERDYGSNNPPSSSTSSVADNNDSKSTTTAEDDHQETQWESFLKNRHQDRPSEDIAGGGGVQPENSGGAGGGFLPDDDE